MLVLLMAQACKEPCVETKDLLYGLHPQVVGSLPYQHGQTINFQRGGELYSFDVEYHRDTISNVNPSCPECCTESVTLSEEVLQILLYDSVHEVKFRFGSGGVFGSVYIDIFPFATGQHANASSTPYYKLDSLGNFICNPDTSITNGTICHDTITIGSTLYYDVAELRYSYGWFYDVRKVYYSQEKGIIKIKWRYDVLEEMVLVE